MALGVYLPLITTNCADWGVTILNVEEGYSYLESIVCAAGAGLGFLLAMVLFSGVRSRVEEAKPPKCMEGLPITLIAAAIVYLSFTGFGGLVEHIFGGVRRQENERNTAGRSCGLPHRVFLAGCC